MRKGRLLFSTVELMLVAALLLAGAAFFVLHFSQEARYALAQWILHTDLSFFLVATLITSIALTLGVCFAAMQTGGYVRFKGHGFSLNEALVRSATLAFWQAQLPKKPLPLEVYCSRGKIEVITPELGEDLEEIEQKLGLFLSRHLGYDREFFITLTQS